METVEPKYFGDRKGCQTGQPLYLALPPPLRRPPGRVRRAGASPDPDIAQAPFEPPQRFHNLNDLRVCVRPGFLAGGGQGLRPVVFARFEEARQ